MLLCTLPFTIYLMLLSNAAVSHFEIACAQTMELACVISWVADVVGVPIEAFIVNWTSSDFQCHT